MKVQHHSNLLELPPNLCENVEVTFHADTWTEFDAVVKWLIENGVPLEHNRKMVRMHGRSPRVEGVTLNVDFRSRFGYVRAEEESADYTVYMPDHLR